MPILGRVVKRFLQLRKKFNFVKGTPVQYQVRVLKKLLRAAKDTEFGIRHDFNTLLRSEDLLHDFQNSVPIFTYDSIYNLWWKRALNGEENVFWPGKVKYFALSSGTSEASSKYIPVTKEMIKAITNASLKQIISMTNFHFPVEQYSKSVLTLGSSTSLNYQNGYYVGDMSGISADQSIPFWVNRFFKPGKEIMKEQDWDTKLNEIARRAKEWDIGAICGIPAWVQIMIERILAYHKVDSLHDIWPNVAAYIHGGIAFAPYKKTFEKFFSRPIEYVETYMASEGFFAFRANPGCNGMQLILNNGVYYEFLPFNRNNFTPEGQMKEHVKPITIDEVNEEEDYAILISTCAGAWRYLIGDTVRFVNADTKELIVTGRTKHFLSICGEHLSVDNMNTALHLTSEELNIHLMEFTVAGIPYENLFAHKWYIGAEEPVDNQRVREVLDEKLKLVNDDYATERANVLKDIAVIIIPNHLFFKWLKTQGKEGAQNKFPRVMDRDQFTAWENFVEQNLHSK